MILEASFHAGFNWCGQLCLRQADWPLRHALFHLLHLLYDCTRFNVGFIEVGSK